MRPPIRLSALAKLPVVYVFTHDSIGVGEDGPTHQPVEHFASLRAIPGMRFFRPAEANETAVAWKCALQRHDGPTVLALTRQKLPTLDPQKYPVLQGRGARRVYPLRCARRQAAGHPHRHRLRGRPGNGSADETRRGEHRRAGRQHAVHGTLRGAGSGLPRQRPAAVRESARGHRGRHPHGLAAGMSATTASTVTQDSFGASGPAKDVFKHFGFTVENVVEKAKATLRK